MTGQQSGTAWILFTERQFGRSRTHALLVDTDGMLIDGMDERLTEQLGEQFLDVDIIALFAEDGSDSHLLAFFKPALRLPGLTDGVENTHLTHEE